MRQKTISTWSFALYSSHYHSKEFYLEQWCSQDAPFTSTILELRRPKTKRECFVVCLTFFQTKATSWMFCTMPRLCNLHWLSLSVGLWLEEVPFWLFPQTSCLHHWHSATSYCDKAVCSPRLGHQDYKVHFWSCFLCGILLRVPTGAPPIYSPKWWKNSNKLLNTQENTSNKGKWMWYKEKPLQGSLPSQGCCDKVQVLSETDWCWKKGCKGRQ